MSREADDAPSRPILGAAAARTRRALAATLGDRVAAAVLAGSTVLYLLVYAVAVGDLGLTGDGAAGDGTTRFAAVDVIVAAEPVARAVGGEAVALVRVGPVEALFAPATLAVALGLAVLVGANLALSVLAWRRPAACAVSPASGLAAGVPALLSGTACCGPLVFLALGVQATSAALTAVTWLRPVAALLLVASLVWAAWRLDVRSPESEFPAKSPAEA
ncbi:hypothetical protein [Halobaculum magnesiiphilum]|uniref:Uncharacterized protein n=1 Tax=Halobaculum magnesiiphilum TaxID=1017351 RepID=A0A8T8WE60_9EURY|nr:hypothetical protein [Halobaculum magnesiiphilum]QZP38121.1 hypothetical protein K6T50_02870 [Halobaculum magnesiiphilum]